MKLDVAANRRWTQPFILFLLSGLLWHGGEAGAANLLDVWRANSLNLNDSNSVSAWSSASNRTATAVVGAPIFKRNATPTGSHAIRFNRNRMAVTNSPVLGNTAFSIAYVFRADVPGANDGAHWYAKSGIVDAEQPGDRADWGTVITEAGQVGIGIGQIDVSLYSSGATLVDGNYHAAVFTWGGGVQSVYVDSRPPVSAASSTTPRTSVGFSFGGIATDENGATRRLVGDIVEVRFYDAALTPTEASTVLNELRTNHISNTRRVLPLGDSITLGLFVAGGYRAPLYQLLTNAGYAIDFVGTQTGNPAPSLPDADHEGWSGYRIRDIDSILPNVFNTIAAPDIILLLLGTNDYRGAGDDPDHATNRLEALVVRMATNWPSAKILVANLLPREAEWDPQIQTKFNPLLPGLCERQRALGRRVYFNDLRSAVLLSDMPDQLHPNQFGYNKIATNWFAAMRPLLDCLDCPPTFTLQPTNQLVLPGANVTLVAAANGFGPLRYQWRFEGTNIANATNASYSFPNASLTNGHGNFSVVATDNITNTTSSNAFIFVSIKPGIVTPPAAQTVLQGRDAIFTCVATGAPPLFYRWIRSGSPVFTNTTGVGIFTNVQASFTNGIRCNVQNAAGSATSANVSLLMIPDADGDGLPDAWETQYGLSPTNAADALLDFDGDGLSNRDEYLSGTDPTDALSVLKLTLATTNTGLLQFVAQSNVAYTIQYRTNLAFVLWNNFSNINAQSQSRTVQVNAPNPPPTRERYYRVVTPPAP